MTISITEILVDSWEEICIFRRTKRNKITGSEFILDEGIYSPPVNGILRIGEKVSSLDSTYNLVEKYIYVFKPNISRLFQGTDSPFVVYLNLYLSSLVLNSGFSSLFVKIKPWANLNYIDWDSNSVPSLEEVEEYYIPFNLTESTYIFSTYEFEEEKVLNNVDCKFKEMKDLFQSFVERNIIGFSISGRNGYIDIFSKDYENNYELRPSFYVRNHIPYTNYNFIQLDIEIVGKSHIIGVCRNRNGEIITGENCKILVFDLSSNALIGSGLSELDGSFRVRTSCKSGTLISVIFINESLEINGSEIMQAFGSLSSSSSSSSST